MQAMKEFLVLKKPKFFLGLGKNSWILTRTCVAGSYCKKWRNSPGMIISRIASFTAKHHSRQIPVSGSHFGLRCEGGQFYCSTSTELVLVCLVVQWSRKWASKTSLYRSEQLSWGKVLIHFFELSFQQTHFLQWFSFGVCLLFCRWVMAVKNSLVRWIVHIWCAQCQFTEKEQKLSF